MSDAPYTQDEFINAEREMTLLTQNSLNKIGRDGNVMFTKLSDITKKLSKGVVRWSNKNSVWPMQFGLACCAIE